MNNTKEERIKRSSFYFIIESMQFFTTKNTKLTKLKTKHRTIFLHFFVAFVVKEILFQFLRIRRVRRTFLLLTCSYNGILFSRAVFRMMIMALCRRWSFMFRVLSMA